MRKVLLGLLGAAVVLALGIGPLVTAANARHIDADDVRGAADAVADAAREGTQEQLQEAIDKLVDLVTGPPDGTTHVSADPKIDGSHPPGPPDGTPPEDIDLPEGVTPGPPDGVPPGHAGPPEDAPPGHAGPPAGVPPGPPEGVPPDDEEPEE